MSTRFRGRVRRLPLCVSRSSSAPGGGRRECRFLAQPHKTGRPVQFEITEETRASLQDWLNVRPADRGPYVFPSRIHDQPQVTARHMRASCVVGSKARRRTRSSFAPRSAKRICRTPRHDDKARPTDGRAFDWELAFLTRLGRSARAARARDAGLYFDCRRRGGKVDYMQTSGVDPRLRPLVIGTELGGGLLVLIGLKVQGGGRALRLLPLDRLLIPLAHE
jgi:hypothetical protein